MITNVALVILGIFLFVVLSMLIALKIHDYMERRRPAKDRDGLRPFYLGQREEPIYQRVEVHVLSPPGHFLSIVVYHWDTDGVVMRDDETGSWEDPDHTREFLAWEPFIAYMHQLLTSYSVRSLDLHTTFNEQLTKDC